VDDSARMAGAPSAHLGGLVGCVVDDDNVKHLASRHYGRDRSEEVDELSIAVALSQRDFSSSAGWTGCGRARGSASSDQSTAQRPGRPDRRGAPRHHRPSPRT
jgi:hypothetical protein